MDASAQPLADRELKRMNKEEMKHHQEELQQSSVACASGIRRSRYPCLLTGPEQANELPVLADKCLFSA